MATTAIKAVENARKRILFLNIPAQLAEFGLRRSEEDSKREESSKLLGGSAREERMKIKMIFEVIKKIRTSYIGIL